MFHSQKGEKYIFHLSNGDEVLSVMNINFVGQELKDELSKFGGPLECQR